MIPALSSFCIFAGVTIFFDFFMQCTLFVAFVTFNERRKANGQRDCLSCCGAPCCCRLCGDCKSKNAGPAPLAGTAYIPCIGGKPPVTAKVAVSRSSATVAKGAEANLKPMDMDKTSPPGSKRKVVREESLSKRVIGRMLPDLILSPSGKLGVIVLTTALLAVGGLGCSR